MRIGASLPIIPGPMRGRVAMGGFFDKEIVLNNELFAREIPALRDMAKNIVSLLVDATLLHKQGEWHDCKLQFSTDYGKIVLAGIKFDTYAHCCVILDRYFDDDQKLRFHLTMVRGSSPAGWTLVLYLFCANYFDDVRLYKIVSPGFSNLDKFADDMYGILVDIAAISLADPAPPVGFKMLWYGGLVRWPGEGTPVYPPLPVMPKAYCSQDGRHDAPEEGCYCGYHASVLASNLLFHFTQYDGALVVTPVGRTYWHENPAAWRAESYQVHALVTSREDFLDRLMLLPFEVKDNYRVKSDYQPLPVGTWSKEIPIVYARPVKPRHSKLSVITKAHQIAREIALQEVL